MSDKPGIIARGVASALERGSRAQGPAVDRYVDKLRAAHPDEAPAQIIERMESQFLRAVTVSGTAVGALAAVPVVGTVASLAAMGAEAAFFLEAASVLTLGVAAVHGIPAEEHETRHSLVLAVALGETGLQIVARATGFRGKNWAEQLGAGVPSPVMRALNSRLLSAFVKRYATRRVALLFGKLAPAGIGAAIGFAGNRALGRTMIANARDAFGAPPLQWPDEPLALQQM
jgi:hypothetical protein